MKIERLKREAEKPLTLGDTVAGQSVEIDKVSGVWLVGQDGPPFHLCVAINLETGLIRTFYNHTPVTIVHGKFVETEREEG